MAIDTLAVITSGGDAPGMNTAIRAIVRSAAAEGISCIGFEAGYHGLINGAARPLKPRDVGDILHRGGTILKAARSDEMRTPAGRAKALRRLNEAGADGLVVIGGDGSLTGAHALAERGFPVVGIPASIDNDIWGTAMSIGVDTAINTIMEIVDRLRDTASSHQRAFLIETMGRDCGYLALMTGVVCGAEVVVIPEIDVTLDEIGEAIAAAYARGKNHAFIVVAEGAKLSVHDIARHLERNDIGFESRITILGHVQRGGNPSAFDRVLATRFGVHAVRCFVEERHDVMVALEGRSITTRPLPEVIGRQRDIDMEYYELIRMLAH